MTSWTLILILYLIQQESATPVKVEIQRIENIASEDLCTKGKKTWLRDHEYAVGETDQDYVAPDDDPKAEQSKEDRFQLVRPGASCIQVR